jgi:hypothetical protein
MRILFLFLTVLILNQGIAQQTYRVQRGERPEINLDAVPENAYHKGVIKIKLQESYTQLMDEMPATVSNGTVVFGIPAIDQLIRQYGISNFGKTFSSPAFTAEFAERHRAWGFHLWYYLYFDESVDVINLVRKFDALPAVVIAEPEYVKVPVYTDKPMGAPEDFSFKGTAWTPDDPRYDEQWHYHNTGQQNGTVDADIDLPEAWEITKGNSGVIVAIVDEGVAISHPDIAANMWSGIGYNFVNNSTTISPGDHGSHVAGTVAGVNNNGVGIAGVAGGTGPGDGVRLMSCQVFTNSSSGGFQNAPIFAADNGAFRKTHGVIHHRIITNRVYLMQLIISTSTVVAKRWMEESPSLPQATATVRETTIPDITQAPSQLLLLITRTRNHGTPIMAPGLTFPLRAVKPIRLPPAVS